MNIFYIDPDPLVAAEQMVDKHVVKMILESAQLLSTAHRLIDGIEYVGQSKSGRKAKRWRLPDERDTVLYSATHVNHPSSVWVRESVPHYRWLHGHLVGLAREYTFRYGKVHKAEETGLIDALGRSPDGLHDRGFSQVVPAMPDEYKVSCAVESYRNYYRVAKARMHKWTKRPTPRWINE
jgi:hypothetical protein